MRNIFLLAAASILPLSACGGESASGGGNVPTSVSPPVQTPTPAPAPSPTPTPQSTQTYVVPDYSSDFALTSSLGYLVNYVEDAPGYFVSGALLAPQSRSFLHYYHAPRHVDFSYDGSPISFSETDRTTDLPLMIFRKGAEAMVLGPWGQMPGKYVTVAWRRTDIAANAFGTSSPGYRLRAALFGTPSATSDPLPIFLGYSGIVWISGGIPGSRSQTSLNVSGGPTAVNWSYTPSSDSLHGSIPLFVVETGAQNQRALLLAEGRLDRATNSVSGVLTDRENGFQGTFRGQIFGPDRAELAIAFEFSRVSDGSAYFGHYVGKR